MQGPQHSGHSNQRVGYRKGYSLHKVSDGNSIFYAGVPDTWCQTCFGSRFHVWELARRVVHVRVR